jgi:Ser/Thr protein kinase RdoA (MazF antagonist)
VADLSSACAQVLDCVYGLTDARLRRVPAGMSTINYVAYPRWGPAVFVKVYPSHVDLAAEIAAIGSSQRAAEAGVPTPEPICPPDGHIIYRDDRICLSVWQFMPGDAGDTVALNRARSASAGAILGRLHRGLADARPYEPALTTWCDVARAHRAIESTLDRLRERGGLDPAFRHWASEVLRWRMGRLPAVSAMLTELSDLSAQAVHGDFVGANLLFVDNRVSAVVDFCPPQLRPAVWEIARLGCAQRAVLRDGGWVDTLGVLLRAYHTANPSVPAGELSAVVKVAVCHMTASVTPFDDLVEPNGLIGALALQRYALARHATVDRLWRHLHSLTTTIREALR